ncbi:DUF4326 domain-containing protein [Rhodococcus sp. T2V]|uniref:DUF4326 domain-containing protein n=1 Tax=Rhodococcus sp. T2V TaxID=3034164 RepID=UPI0023E1E8D5|nr:DUF4326 domain-containing protein [Rhodococcus sp. T2V]MDF3308734.1 DUF4326 domain-containing protein [Rhodococcus sp. T2V]
MVTPKRIQRKRTKDWRMPEGAVYVGRPSRWGNPYVGTSRADAVALFEDMLRRAPVGDTGRTVYESIRHHLRGKDLVCWCPLDEPCHADVLLELANGGTQ